jgi:cytochrome c
MKKLLIMYCSALIACNNNTVEHTPPATVQHKDSTDWPAHFGFGREATPQQIAQQDIDVRPDGQELPAGTGNAAAGKSIYKVKCAACHGDGTIAADKLPAPALFGNDQKAKTIGNYWPYATTIFDYVRRAMPFNAPGSLTDTEVYHLTAYLLYANNIIGEKESINAQTLPAVKMPAHDRFVNDDRHGGAEVK